MAKTNFLSISEAVQDGSVQVGQLKLISEGQYLQQFIDLYKIMATAERGSSVDERPVTRAAKSRQVDKNTRAILRLLNTRKKELEALQDQIKLNKTLVTVCRAISPVDCGAVEQKLRANVDELQLNKVCQPITMQQLEQQGSRVQPNITFFSHCVDVQSMLQHLHDIQECRVFKKLMKAQAARVRQSKGTDVLAILEVFTQVFRPVYSNQLVEVLTNLRTEAITLGEVDHHFLDIKNKPQVIQTELQMLALLRPDQGQAWVKPRLKQIQDYYQVQNQAQAAGELLKIRAAFDLKGNFKPMEILNNVNSPAFKQQPLQAINQDVIQAARILKDVGQKEVDCLRQLAQCKELINWVRQEIKDVQELKVFVDLAMISAGETDMEVDRVSCFHRAATGYAPFIFELKENAGYRDLLRMTQKVWKALASDHDLPKKLRDTQRQLFWLKEVKDSQGSVETSSLSQADAINARGVYTVGNLHEGGNSTATQKLRVTMREMTVDEDEERERVYTLEALRDLQSRLTLVAGKTQEDRQGLQTHVDRFVDVFTAAQQLASTYSKLCLAGCILFKEWKAILYCGKAPGEVSVHVDFGAMKLLCGTRPLMIELNFLRAFMDDCLNEWHRYVDEQRSRCYELNNFTTEQLVLLRQHLAQVSNIRQLPAQVYVLLSSVKQMCNQADIEGAIKAAMRQVAREAAPAPMEAEEVDNQSPEATEADILNEKKAVAKKLMDDYLFDERMALAVVEAVGLEHADGDYVEWCIEHEDDTDLIQELVSGLQAQGLVDEMTDEGETAEEMDEEDSGEPEEEEMFESFPSIAKTMTEVTQGLLRDINRGELDTQLKQLWENHFHSMKSIYVEDCLSLEHLGLILHHLAEADESIDTTAPRPRAVQAAPCEQTRQTERVMENHRVATLPPVDLTRLLQESLHAAASRIGDSDERMYRTTERITLLQLFLQQDLGQGALTFLSVIKQRVTALTGEWEERRGSKDAWLNNEAIAVGKVQESGTFRRCIWQHLVSIVTPLLAEVLAFCDYNDNLSLLSDHQEGHWQHQLWLAILVDPLLSPIHYKDFLSPKNLVLREKALVKVLGSGQRHFTAKLSFSWLLKNHLEMAHTTARELKANTEQSTVHEVFCNQVMESPWGRLLNQIVPVEASQQFLEAYMMDYVCMMYTAKSDMELECVCQALQVTSQVVMREAGQGSNLIQSLVALHMAYVQTQARLSHFARLVEVYPDLVDPKNIPRLANLGGEMTLDAKAIHVTVDSLLPNDKECKERQSQHAWLRKVQAARPVIETLLEAILHDNTHQYGPAVLQIVHNTKQMWDRISVQRLFVENVCPPNADVEQQVAQQGLLLWKGLRNVSSMKEINGLNHLEKTLNLCNRSTKKLHFKYGFDDCPICKMTIQNPVELPCHHVCCQDCIKQLFHVTNQRKCPTCREDISPGFKPIVTKANKAALDKFHGFRQRCNTFFMDVVSQLCFADGTTPSHDVVTKLLSYVTRKVESDEDEAGGLQTKRLTAFPGDCIDRTPVIRSVLLQLLLQSSVGEVHAYMSQYLEQAQQVLANSPAHEILDVCTLFINCIEDASYCKASSQANPSVGLLQHATRELHQAAAWLRRKTLNEGLTVQYLQAVAGARFGLVVTAQFLHELYCTNRIEDRVVEREVRNLFDEANAFCSVETNHQAHLFLIRQLCHCYGTNTMETLSQHTHLRWVKPRELRTAVTQVPDRFVVCGDAYRDIREALAQLLITQQFNGVVAAVRDCHTSKEQRESALLLALYREVTLSHCAQEDQEEASPQIKQQLQTYIQNSPAITCKEFVRCLVDNRLGPMLSAAAGQQVLHQTLASLIIHTVTTLSSAPNHHLLRPLRSLLATPVQMQNSFLPTMPEDYRREAMAAIAATDQVTWYVCPNGHPYAIGECGRPNQQGRCQDCGQPIGGGNHRFTAGGQAAAMRDTTTAGHVLGDARNRGTRAIPERKLNAISISILRAILHATMMGATLRNQTAIQQLIHPAPSAHIGEFLLQHLLTDLNHLAAASGKSQEDCLFIIHMVLHIITTTQARNGSGGASWPNKQSRLEWETQFTRTFIAPIMENLDQRLTAANDTLRNDQRFSANPLMRLLHQPVMTGVVKRDDLNQLHSLSAIWQHKPRINVESLQQYLTQSVQQGQLRVQEERPLALLEAFLEQEHILRVLRHLPDIIRLQQMLIDKFHRCIDATEATSTSIQDFLDSLPPGHYQNQIQPLIGVFLETWNQVRELIPNNSGRGLTVPRELCIDVMSESSSLAMILPTRREAGVCSTALVAFLIGAHNGFINAYHRLKSGLPEPTEINPCDASIGHLVAYHHERDLLPMILSHCDYSMEAGSQGTRLTYNLYGLQRQIKERFLQGRPKLKATIEQLVFRQDSRDASVFQALRTSIPQEPLSPAIKHQILSELRSFPDLCDCLAALDIAIGFLVKTASEPAMRIREYLHNLLKLPLDRGLRHSPKAQQHCRLYHVLSLWQVLAVERARRLLRSGQDPFEGVNKDFCKGINHEQEYQLGQSLRHLNVDHLVAELYEYIVLNLKKSDNEEQDESDESKWSISATLSAYIDSKDGHPIHEIEKHLSDDLQMQHAVTVWQYTVEYMQQQQARANMMHH